MKAVFSKQAGCCKQKLRQVQWTLTYPATTGPYQGQISEITGYVNHHANNASLLALPFLLPVMVSIIGAHISVSSGFGQSKIQHPRVVTPPFKHLV